MSEPSSLYPDVDEQLWERYLNECRISNTIPTMSDYSVFLSDLEMDVNDCE